MNIQKSQFKRLVKEVIKQILNESSDSGLSAKLASMDDRADQEKAKKAASGYLKRMKSKKSSTENPSLPNQIFSESKIQDPTKEEMMLYIKQQYGGESGWEDDAEVAIYWFSNFYHGGQWSNLYSALSTSPFNPGPIARGPQKDSMEEMMYRDLVSQFAGGEGLDDEENVQESNVANGAGQQHLINGQSNVVAASRVNKILSSLSKGMFSDNSWEAINKIFNKLQELGLDVTITSAKYGGHADTESGMPKFKEWQISIPFTNKNGKPTLLVGQVTAHGAGSMEQPLDRYDITAYVSPAAVKNS